MTTKTTFSCRFCGRIYPLQSELMGRSIRCKCGRPVQVPGVRQRSQVPVPSIDEGNFLRCPKCENRIPAGEHLCAECGFNLRTGEVETLADDAVAETRVTNTIPSAIRNPQTDLYEQQQKRTTLILVGGFVLLVIGTVAAIWLYNRSSSPQVPVNLPGEDAVVLEMMDSDAPREALEWLNVHPSRMFSGMTRPQAEDRVRMLYSMGAKRVTAFGSGMAAVIAVELPDDREKRNEIFEWQARWHQQHRHRVFSDLGQKYLLIRFGI